MQKLKMGDVVKLKSGGPKMTICGIKEEDRSAINCVWFASDYDGPFYNSFFESNLELIGDLNLDDFDAEEDDEF